jgi:hypothetical protein
VFAASMRVKRNVYTRNMYEFTLPYRYSYLEGMDVVLITTSSDWAAGLNNQNLGVVNLPVRIKKVTDKADGTLDFVAEDYPFGAHAPSLFHKAVAMGTPQPNEYSPPGNAETVLFEAPNRLTGFSGDQIWIGASGASPDWGGCNVLASMDGDTYTQIGTVKSAARIGVLASAFPVGADPDTADSLVVNLTPSSGPLEAGTTANADADATLCYLGGELLSYSACTVTGEDQYTASGYIRRGRMGSAIADHPAGTPFMRLDSAVLKYSYDATWRGKTVLLKFQSFNAYGGKAVQDMAALTAVSFAVPGLAQGTVDGGTGIVTSQFLPPNVATNVAANAALSSAYNGTTSTSSVSVFGPGGVGTAWAYQAGTNSTSYAAATITGVDPTSGEVIVAYNIQTGVYTLVPATSYQMALGDFLIVLGTVTVATATGGGTSGGATGGGYACTVEGTLLDTPDGPVDNREIFAAFNRDESVFLQGRYGPEKVTAAEWISEDQYYRVETRSASFGCSASHMVRVEGHYLFAATVGQYADLETRGGYRTAEIYLVPKPARVLHIHLSGPSHEYSVGGVYTHNIKNRGL